MPVQIASVQLSSQVNFIRIDCTKTLRGDLAECENVSVQCHGECVSSYTSKSHVQRHLKITHEETQKSEDSTAVKRYCRSELPTFTFWQHCSFCGEECIMDLDPQKSESLASVVRDRMN